MTDETGTPPPEGPSRPNPAGPYGPGTGQQPAHRPGPFGPGGQVPPGADPAGGAMQPPGPPPGSVPPAPPMPPPGGEAAMGAPGSRPPRRGMPTWAVLVVVLVVALVSAGVGGFVGGRLGSPAAGGSSPDEEVKLNNAPSDAPSRAPDTIAGVAQRVSPSVVSIQPDDRARGGNGSGFIIDDDHVVTNFHVAGALEEGMEVAYSNGRTSPADIVGTRPESDLAVLKIRRPLRDVEPLQFGTSKDVTVGDQVIAIGAPLGLAGTVTTGIISAKDRSVALGEDGARTDIKALQTDAAINPGNSGGPLVDEQGRVIGVNTAIATMGGATGEQSGSIGLGFAIPSDVAKEVVDEIIDGGSGGGAGESGGSSSKAALGVALDTGYQDGGAQIADEEGAVTPGGPADEAGLRPGDVITRFDGRTVTDSETLQELVADKKPDDTVEIEYERDGKSETTEVTL
ncbi:S1C family serine protease [Nocardiopsis composta]|uniref:Putative serine protease PepD n=1 Tax=Nocardiopsis composta TaxID=157465 RepID=A0A7W8VG46_9ACTN|nr:trypsin-like peptidase domain-containing protein [Nocardiopsis composta]MBB5434785.1 putative serine protease PepD [Nocardiopsis composta]